MTTPVPGTQLVTVFGGSGFLGRNIVRALAKAGWRIRVAVRRPNAAYFLPPMGQVGQIQMVKCDVREDAAVAEAIAGAQAAVNLVGILAQRGQQRYAAIHIDAAERIARLAKEAKVARLIHVSALGADAKAPARYFKSKAEGEARVRAAFPKATILRPSIVFGPDDNFFNRFAALARFLPVLPLFGGGRTRFQPVFVGDVAEAVVRVLDDAKTAGKTYELGGPEVMTFKQVMQLVLKETGRRRLLLPLPFFFGRIQGAVLQFLPFKLLTLDQVRMLQTDTVVGEGALGLKELGITPTAAEAILPAYLWRFRKAGQFEMVRP